MRATATLDFHVARVPSNALFSGSWQSQAGCDKHGIFLASFLYYYFYLQRAAKRINFQAQNYNEYSENYDIRLAPTGNSRDNKLLLGSTPKCLNYNLPKIHTYVHMFVGSERGGESASKRVRNHFSAPVANAHGHNFHENQQPWDRRCPWPSLSLAC